MNQSLICAVAAMAFYGLSDFIYKRAAAAGIRADYFLMVQGWFFGPVVILYAVASHTFIPASAALWGSLAGVFIFVGFYFFIRSLTTGSISTNVSIFRLNFIITVALVIAVLGEPLTPGKIAGLALALLATWLLVTADAAANRRADSAQRRSLMEVALATVAFGASNFFHTIGLRHGAVPEMLAVAQAALFMPLATAVVYFADGKLQPPPATFKYSAAAAIALLGATIFLLHGVAGGQASVIVPIAQMGFVVATLLGFFALHERITLRKALGLASAFAALTVLAGS